MRKRLLQTGLLTQFLMALLFVTAAEVRLVPPNLEQG